MNTKTKRTLELAKALISHHANGGDWEAQQSQRVIEAINECLAMPERNCDRLANAQEALTAIHNDRCYVQNPIDERRLTVNWLFREVNKLALAEAKEENNENA